MHLTRTLLALLLASPAAVLAFAPGRVGSPLAPRSTVVVQGFFDGLFGGEPDPAKEAWKEEALREQQRILAKRRQTGGFISAEEEEEIAERRKRVGQEAQLLKEVQSGGDGKDRLADWKKLRDSGKIRTSTKGLERDKGSSRLGSEGLFAERVDERLPYIDQGYVPEEEEGEDLASKIKGFFGGRK